VDLVRALAHRDGQWKRANPGRPVPLAMFATVANAVMWLGRPSASRQSFSSGDPAALGLKAK